MSHYTTLSNRITHGGRSVDRSAHKQRRIALMPMAPEPRSWWARLLGEAK